MKGASLISALILILVMVTGCGNEISALNNTGEIFCKVTDSAGREVVLAKKPKRIVVTSASFIEPIYEVGGKIVGRPSSKNKSVELAKDAAEIGTVYQIDTEKLLACEPDLVILNKGMNEKLSTILDENKIPYVVADMKTYDAVKSSVFMFAEFTEQYEKALKLVEDMDAQIKDIVDHIPHEKKRVAILHGTAQGLSVQLAGSIAGNVVYMLGWENVASGMDALEGKADTAPYSLETLIEQNPEIIFVTSMGDIDEITASVKNMISENAAWQTIPAIQNNRLYFLPQSLFLLSPGVDYPEAVKYVARLIYPGVSFGTTDKTRKILGKSI